jgi:hypothetical protein
MTVPMRHLLAFDASLANDPYPNLAYSGGVKGLSD